MSQLVRLLKNAGRVSGRPTAGFGSRQEGARKRLVLVAALDGPDTAAAKKAIAAGADVVEVPAQSGKSLDQVKSLVGAVNAPVGMRLEGDLSADFDFKS